MKKTLIAVAATAILFGAPALAADMPLKAPPAPMAWSWTGFYIGADAGVDWSRDSVSPTVPDGSTFPRSNTLNTSGVLGGATLGYNWQAGTFLYGLEGDLGYMGIGGAKADPLGGTEIDNLQSGWYGDITGRAGITWGNALLYGKGGWAYYSGRGFTTTAIPGFTGANSGAFSGWTAGGGLEYKLSAQWSTKFEYLHYDFGTQSATLTNGVGTVFPYANHLTMDTVKFGVNYQFGGPISTRY